MNRLAAIKKIATQPLIEPQEFCSRYIARYAGETEDWGYRQRCVKELAALLGSTPGTVNHWGAGLNFPKMPQWAREKLTLLDRVHRLQVQAVRELI